MERWNQVPVSMMKRQTRKCVLVSLLDSPAAVTLFSTPVATCAERDACMVNWIWTQNLDLYRNKDHVLFTNYIVRLDGSLREDDVAC